MGAKAEAGDNVDSSEGGSCCCFLMSVSGEPGSISLSVSSFVSSSPSASESLDLSISSMQYDRYLRGRRLAAGGGIRVKLAGQHDDRGSVSQDDE